MAQIKIDLAGRLIDGMTVKFKAPCDCTEVTGLLVSYVGDTGAAASKSFTFRDCHNNDLAGLGNLFGEGAYVVAILDANRGYAYLQNADTNAYLEQGAANFPDRSIIRDKLANNALYSPIQMLNTQTTNGTSYTIPVTHSGYTFVVNVSGDMAITLTQAVSNSMGGRDELAIYWYNGTGVTILPSGVRFAVYGQSSPVKKTLRMTGKYGVVSLKRIAGDTTSGDAWAVSGNVEVVE